MPTIRPAPQAPPRCPSGDGGFSLVEVLVALAIIGTVMAGVAPFLVSSLSVSDKQTDNQVAIQLATDGLERVRALNPSSLLTGRGANEVDRQWNEAPPAVKRHLDTMRRASDPMLPVNSTNGQTAPLPTKAYVVKVNGKTYQQQWYVGRCWQPKLAIGGSGLGTCTAPADPAVTPTGAPYFRALVSITWTHRACPGQTCVYVASTLASIGTDPVFDTKRPPPTVKNPGDQLSYVTDAVSLQLASTGGVLPLTWTVTGLPAGLTMAANGLITGMPTTAGTYAVKVTVTDRKLQADTVNFNWTIRLAPALVSPGDQLSWTGTPVSLPLAATGGLAPLKWTATGLPAGLTLNASTGLISGTPTTVQLVTTSVTVTEAGTPARSVTVTFPWQVLIPMSITFPSPQTGTIGQTITAVTPSASGGLAPYTWTSTGLPPGLTMDSQTGRVSGVPTSGTRYLLTVRITDSIGNIKTLDVVYNINTSTGSDLKITFPNPSSPDRSTTRGTSVSFTADAAGANRPQWKWSATGLPPGMTIGTNGVVSGTPTTTGTYYTTLTVTSQADGTGANLMFIWSVT